VVISRADQPAIVLRFLSTSERFLFSPIAAVAARLSQHLQRRTTVRVVQ
jgi:hypothetical protein